MSRRCTNKDEFNEIHTIIIDLPTSIRGFCYHDNLGEAYIVLNARLTYAQQKQTWRHEFRHIKNGDMFNPAYIEYQ